MRLNLFSLAPNSFILGSLELLQQFYPKKVFDIPWITKNQTTSDTLGNVVSSDNNTWGVEIHLTSRCPLRCVRCSYGKRNRDGSELSPEVVARFLRSIDRFNVGSVIFSGGGDPLAWKGGKFVDCLVENVRYKRAIATNGLGLMKTMNQNDLKSLDIVQINISGYSEDSYLRTTRTHLFKNFVKNIQWLFNHREAHITQVTGKIVIDNKNYKEIGKYLEFCAQMPFDLVVIKLAGNFESGQDVALKEDQKKELRSLMYQSPVLKQYPGLLDAIATDDNSVELDLPTKCWVVEYNLYMLIRSNGDIFPCVTSPYCRENRIGNLYESDISEIWANPMHHKIKHKLNEDMRCLRCNLDVCRHMRYNLLLEETVDSSRYINLLPETKKVRPKLL